MVQEPVIQFEWTSSRIPYRMDRREYPGEFSLPDEAYNLPQVALNLYHTNYPDHHGRPNHRNLSVTLRAVRGLASLGWLFAQFSITARKVFRNFVTRVVQ